MVGPLLCLHKTYVLAILYLKKHRSFTVFLRVYSDACRRTPSLPSWVWNGKKSARISFESVSSDVQLSPSALAQTAPVCPCLLNPSTACLFSMQITCQIESSSCHQSLRNYSIQSIPQPYPRLSCPSHEKNLQNKNLYVAQIRSIRRDSKAELRWYKDQISSVIFLHHYYLCYKPPS